MISRRSLLAGAAGAFAIPGMKQGTVARAYLGLSKDVGGQGNSRLLATSTCNTANVPCSGPRGSVAMIKAHVAMSCGFASHAPCDEVTESGTLVFTWTVVARIDPAMGVFGTHVGPFTYKDSCGNEAKGTMVGTIACGTHRAPALPACEDCRDQLHFEGYLTGKFVSGPFFVLYGSTGGAFLHASYAGQLAGSWPSSISGVVMSVDGVYDLPCLP